MEASADEEVIYSFDGEDPVTIAKPPLPETTPKQQVSDETPSAPQAFETFAGKVYRPAPTSFLGAFGAAKEETALERLGRLQHEIAQLEQDLTTTTSTTTTLDDNDDNDEEEDATLDLILNVQQLKVRLARVGVIPPQETLTQNVQHAATHLQQPLSSAPSTTDTAVASSALERRLQRLEHVIGSSTTTTTSADASLPERLQALETVLQKLDDKELETKAKKAKVIRQDLEAASKARNKLMAAGTASDTKLLGQLHDQMVQLHGLTPHLPTLVQRLQALSRQHQDAALQQQQLQTVQGACDALEPQVQQLEAALQSTQEQLTQTAQQMMDNLKALDQRLEHLNK